MFRICFKSAVVETHFRGVIRGFLNPSPTAVGKSLVLLSGGPSSLALAFMMGETVNNKSTSKRRMFVSAELLHIDESIFYPWDVEHEQKNVDKLKKFASLVNLPLTIVSIAEKYKLTPETAKQLVEANSERGSCREDTIQFLRNSVIEDFSLKKNFDKLLVGDSALRVWA